MWERLTRKKSVRNRARDKQNIKYTFNKVSRIRKLSQRTQHTHNLSLLHTHIHTHIHTYTHSTHTHSISLPLSCYIITPAGRHTSICVTVCSLCAPFGFVLCSLWKLSYSGNFIKCVFYVLFISSPISDTFLPREPFSHEKLWHRPRYIT